MTRQLATLILYIDTACSLFSNEGRLNQDVAHDLMVILEHLTSEFRQRERVGKNIDLAKSL